MLLIGSAAYSNNYKDIDLVVNNQELDQLYRTFPIRAEPIETDTAFVYPFGNKYIIEAILPKSDSWYTLIPLGGTKWLDLFGFVNVPSIRSLLEIKKAHLILPIKWQHHISEYCKLKEKAEIGIFTPDSLLFKAARKYALSKARKHPKLNKQKDEFFGNDGVTQVFDHDSIHEAISYPAKPAYQSIIDGEVFASRDKWNQLTFSEKLRCVIEEASVLALERSIIPHLFLQNKKYYGQEWAYNRALFKVCTTITSGFFRDFAIEVFDIAAEQKPNLINILFNGLNSGVIKKND